MADMDKPIANLTVYKADGTVWTRFDVSDPCELAAFIFEWQAQPGCERLRVEGRPDWTQVAVWQR